MYKRAYVGCADVGEERERVFGKQQSKKKRFSFIRKRSVGCRAVGSYEICHLHVKRDSKEVQTSQDRAAQQPRNEGPKALRPKVSALPQWLRS